MGECKYGIKIIDKPCEGCGEMMYQVTTRRRFCPKCAYTRNLQMAQACAQRKKEQKENEARKKMSIDETVRAAMEKGLSYGQYVALYKNGG